MEVKVGYKQTEIGIIPDDWEVKPLQEISPSQSVGLVINPSTYFDDNGTVPMLVGSNIEENRIHWDTARLITAESNRRIPASQLRANDLVTVRVGDPGITAVVPLELDGCNCASMMIVRQHSSFNSQWLSYLMNSRVGIAQIRNVQYGTAQKQFNISHAINFIYPVPSLTEQEAIAEALSDADTLIEALEQLLAKKRQVKQGAMQELLTGKRRLPGFSGEWSKVSMREVLTQSATYGIVTAGAFVHNGTKMLRGGDIVDGRVNTELPMVSQAKAAEYSRTTLIKDDVVIALVGYPGASAKIPNNLIGANISRAVGLLRLNKKVSPDYLVCFLNSPDGRRMVLAPSAGSAQQVVNLAALNKLEFKLPAIDEQTVIAEILSDMDAEIAALEGKLSKARQVKQGMMSELLTGRVRLV
jgi:type I restriction enzyme, S subunit